MKMALKDEFLDLKKQLRKTFTTLKEWTAASESLENSSRTRIRSIANLTEQLQSCLKVKDLEDPVLTEFPDVKDRLSFKLTFEITEDLHHLKIMLQKLTDCSECLAKQSDLCLSKLEKHNSQENLLLLTRRKALCPSVSDIIEMVQRSNSQVRESCLCKKFLLEDFSPEKVEGAHTLEKEWFLGDTKILSQIQDYLTVTSYFMEEKIT